MSATRDTFRSTTSGAVTGNAFLDQVSDNTKKFYDQSTLPLTGVGGTADAVTASVTPDFDADGLTPGAKFTVTWAADNTGPVTLSINGETAVAVVDAEGGSLAAGALRADLRSLIEYNGTEFRLLTGVAPEPNPSPSLQQAIFDTSGTWVVPTGVTRARFRVLGAGGAGGSGSAQGADGGTTSVSGANLSPALTVQGGLGGLISSSTGPSFHNRDGRTITGPSGVVRVQGRMGAPAIDSGGGSGGIGGYGAGAEIVVDVSGSYAITIGAGGSIHAESGLVVVEWFAP